MSNPFISVSKMIIERHRFYTDDILVFIQNLESSNLQYTETDNTFLLMLSPYFFHHLRFTALPDGSLEWGCSAFTAAALTFLIIKRLYALLYCYCPRVLFANAKSHKLLFWCAKQHNFLNLPRNGYREGGEILSMLRCTI